MSARDGKNNFYRQLDLDGETNKILKWYRETKKQLMDDKVKEVLDDQEDST